MKKKLGKVLALILCLCLILALGACGSSTPATTAAPTTTKAPETKAPETQAPQPTEAPTTAAPEIPYPTKPITVIVGYNAGGGTDLIVRKLVEIMSEDLGQPINVQNVPGGSGSTAGIQVNATPSDGYTILAGPANMASPWRTNNYCDLGWENWFACLGSTAAHAVLVPKNSQFQTIQDFVDYCKAHPGELKWGHSGFGSMNQTSGDMMLKYLGLEATSIPYGGGSEVATKLLAGEIDFTWLAFNECPDFIASGDLRALAIMRPEDVTVDAVTGSYTVPSFPKAYPATEPLQGILSWGLHIKRDTDPAIVAKLVKSFIKATEDQRYIDYLASINVTPACLYGQASDELTSFLEAFVSWGLADLGMAAEGISPADFDIPKVEDFKFPANDKAKNAIPWPEL